MIWGFSHIFGNPYDKKHTGNQESPSKITENLVWQEFDSSYCTAMRDRSFFAIHKDHKAFMEETIWIQYIDLLRPSDRQDCGHNDLLLKLTGAANMVDYFRT